MLCCKSCNRTERFSCTCSEMGRVFNNGFVALFIIAITLVISMFVISTISANTEDKAMQFEEVVVQSNDTLWSLARRYRPDEDPRRVVWYIKKLNECGTQIHPGQTLKIPVF